MKGGWEILSINKSKNATDIYIQLSAVLVNNSSNKLINMTQFGTALERSLKVCYEFSSYEAFYESPEKSVGHLDGYDYLYRRPFKVFKLLNAHLSVKWRISALANPLNEHLVEIKDDKDLSGVYAKVNNIYGSIVYVNANKVSGIISGFDRNTLAHEFGHSLGLLHPDINTAWFGFLGYESNQYWTSQKRSKDSLNMMYSGGSPYMNDSLSTHISSSQMRLVIENIRQSKVNQ